MSGAGVGEVFAAFPRRPLTLHPPPAPLGARLATMLGAVFFIGILIASLVWVLPPLQSDWMIRNSAVPVRGEVERGRCQSKLIFHTCDITLVVTPPRAASPSRPFATPLPLDPATAPIRRDVTYFFVDLHIGGYTLDVMADPRYPALLSSDLGLGKLVNRTVSLAGAWVFMLAIILVGGHSAWRSSRMRNAVLAMSGQVLAPMQLELTGLGPGKKTATWNVRRPGGGVTSWTMPAAARPFLLGPGLGMLGVAGPTGGAVFPLDAELRWIGLTERERAAIFAAQARSIAAAQAALDASLAAERGR